MRAFLSMTTLGVPHLVLNLMTVLHRDRESLPVTGAVQMTCAIISQSKDTLMETTMVGGRTAIPQIRRGTTPTEAVMEGAEVQPTENIRPVDGKTMVLPLLLITS